MVMIYFLDANNTPFCTYWLNEENRPKTIRRSRLMVDVLGI
jgi:hypothetical protein